MAGSARAADRQRVHAQRGLADAHRNFLAFLAAGADAVVELEVVADHRDAGHDFGAVADQRGALDRARDPAVLDQVGLAGREHELARRDVDLAAAEIAAVQALVDRGDDFFRRMLAGQHVGVGHARHRGRREALAPAVARRLHAHQARVELVLQVAAQDAVLDQRGALGGRAFVVDVERAAACRERAVVDDGDALGGDLLSDAAAECRSALAIEVAFETMAHGFVQQHAGPAGAEHDGHGAGRCRHRFEIDLGRAHRFFTAHASAPRPGTR